MSKNNKGFLLGAIIGGTAAAAAALLLAPKSGKEMREELLEQLDDVSEGKASDYVDYAQFKGYELSDLAKQKTEEYGWINEKVANRFNTAKETSTDLLHDFKGKAAEVTSEFKSASDDLEYAIEELEENTIVLDENDLSDDLYEAIEKNS